VAFGLGEHGIRASPLLRQGERHGDNKKAASPRRIAVERLLREMRNAARNLLFIGTLIFVRQEKTALTPDLLMPFGLVFGPVDVRELIQPIAGYHLADELRAVSNATGREQDRESAPV
jgi:hypothetical protein